MTSDFALEVAKYPKVAPNPKLAQKVCEPILSRSVNDAACCELKRKLLIQSSSSTNAPSLSNEQRRSSLLQKNCAPNLCVEDDVANVGRNFYVYNFDLR